MTIADDCVHVQAAGTDVRVRHSGPQGAPPVLLLHGIGSGLEYWKDAHDLLAEDHRVLSMDFPGFGFTRAGTARPGLASFAESAVEVLDAVGEERPVHVMGNSLGGAVTMTLAARRPERVASTVLACSAGFGRVTNLDLRPLTFAMLGLLPVLGRPFATRARPAHARAQRDLFAAPERATEEWIRYTARLGRQPDSLRTFLPTALSLGLPLIGSYPWWRRRLLAAFREAAIPTLVVWGDHDRLLPPEHLEAAARALPHARTHLMEDTGHLPMTEHPARFVELVRPFVAEHA